jgi:hypothetical protein
LRLTVVKTAIVVVVVVVGQMMMRKENEKRKKKLNSCSKMSIVALVVLFFACASAQSSIDYDTLTAGFQLLPSAVAGQPSLIVPVRPRCTLHLSSLMMSRSGVSFSAPFPT